MIAISLAEPDRFAEIFDRHFATVFRFAERRVGRDQASEVASETLTRAFARRGSFRPDAVEALPWLLGIASRLILQERRRFVRYLAAVDRASADLRTVDREADLGSADRRLDAPSDWARMREALLTLSDTDRELLLLVAWEERSYAIAVVTVVGTAAAAGVIPDDVRQHSASPLHTRRKQPSPRRSTRRSSGPQRPRPTHAGALDRRRRYDHDDGRPLRRRPPERTDPGRRKAVRRAFRTRAERVRPR